MADDPMADLKRLGAETLTPCGVCRRHILETKMPLFYRAHMSRAALDAMAINERAGLCMMMGGPQAAGIAEVFATRQPVIVIEDLPTINVCQECASKTTLEMIYFMNMGSEESIQVAFRGSIQEGVSNADDSES